MTIIFNKVAYYLYEYKGIKRHLEVTAEKKKRPLELSVALPVIDIVPVSSILDRKLMSIVVAKYISY